MLVKCPECGRENVSDKAEACPGCGYNVREHYEKIHDQENEEKELEQWLLEQEKEKEEQERQWRKEEKKREQEEYERRLQNIPMPKKPKFFDPSNNILLIIGIVFDGFGLFFLIFDIVTDSFEEMGFETVAILIIGSIFLLGGLYIYNNKKNDYYRAVENFDKYRHEELYKKMKREEESLKQQSHTIVICPNCGSANTCRISMLDRVISDTMVGRASPYLGKSYQCRDCRYKW